MNAALWIISGLLATVLRVPCRLQAVHTPEEAGQGGIEDQGQQLRASVRRDRAIRIASSRRALF
jgi:hypothetical protein